jgi:hypothetical protein
MSRKLLSVRLRPLRCLNKTTTLANTEAGAHKRSRTARAERHPQRRHPALYSRTKRAKPPLCSASSSAPTGGPSDAQRGITEAMSR